MTIRNLRAKAKKLGLAFNLTREDLIVPDKCPYLGIKLIAQVGRKPRDCSPSVDRIIPEKGYIKGNIEIISHLANRMKNKANLIQMVDFAKAVLERYG